MEQGPKSIEVDQTLVDSIVEETMTEISFSLKEERQDFHSMDPSRELNMFRIYSPQTLNVRPFGISIATRSNIYLLTTTEASLTKKGPDIYSIYSKIGLG